MGRAGGASTPGLLVEYDELSSVKKTMVYRQQKLILLSQWTKGAHNSTSKSLVKVTLGKHFYRNCFLYYSVAATEYLAEPSFVAIVDLVVTSLTRKKKSLLDF